MTQLSGTVVRRRHFIGREAGMLLPPSDLAVEARAALGQFSIERLMAYGLNHADAIELRGRVGAGEPWRDVAISLADDLLATIGDNATIPSRINVGYRASALMRMAQVMMIEDTDERRALFTKAAALFREASALAGNPTREDIFTADGAIVTWIYRPHVERVGIALVIGGIEGWAMDFAELSRWLVQRGVEVWCVDGPGQGESRFVHGHYLHVRWRDVFHDLVTHIKHHNPDAPIGIVGSSVGGTFAFELAANDPRIELCCSNGGPMNGRTILGQQEAKVPKKRMMCGPHLSGSAVDEIWDSIDVAKIGARVRCPVLVIHGGRDPLISDDEMQRLFESLASSEKQFLTFSDGDHCIYNHADDKHIAISDWVTQGLRRLYFRTGSTALSA